MGCIALGVWEGGIPVSLARPDSGRRWRQLPCLKRLSTMLTEDKEYWVKNREQHKRHDSSSRPANKDTQRSRRDQGPPASMQLRWYLSEHILQKAASCPALRRKILSTACTSHTQPGVGVWSRGGGEGGGEGGRWAELSTVSQEVHNKR